MISQNVVIRARRPIHLLTRSSLRLHSTTKDDEASQALLTASPLSTKIRTLMRSTPHPLTTIVAFSRRRPNTEDNRPNTACGLLVSSFNTVTLDPRPFVSFNIKRPSSTYDAICQSGSFTASGIRSVTVTDAFVKSRGVIKALEQIVGEEGKLKDTKGGTWWMSCRLAKEHCVEVGDHVVVIGEVIDAASYGAEDGKGMGLVYAEGSYRKVGEALGVEAEQR